MLQPDFQLPKRKIPKVHQFELVNGLRGLLIDIADCSSMAVELHFQAGDYFTPTDKPELAHFLEHLVLGANKEYPSTAALSETFKRFGGYYNAHTGNSRICYEFETPDFDWQRLFKLLLVTISNPLFLVTEFDTEREVIRHELTARTTSEREVFSRDLSIKLGIAMKSMRERIDKLNNIDLESLKSYYRETHGPGNCRLIVAGSLPSSRRDWIQRQLQYLDKLPAKKAIWQPNPPDKLQSIGIFHRTDSKPQLVDCLLGFINNQRPLQLPEIDALMIMRNLWGDGEDSRILGELRRRGLIYHIRLEKIITDSSTLFGFTGQIQPENIEEIISLILTEIDRLLTGDLHTSEVEVIKNKLLGANLLKTFTPTSWIDHYRDTWLDHDVIISSDYQKRYDAINRSSIIALARHLFEPKQWTIGLYGPTSPALRRNLKLKLNNWQPAQSS